MRHSWKNSTAKNLMCACVFCLSFPLYIVPNDYICERFSFVLRSGQAMGYFVYQYFVSLRSTAHFMIWLCTVQNQLALMYCLPKFLVVNKIFDVIFMFTSRQASMLDSTVKWPIFWTVQHRFRYSGSILNQQNAWSVPVLSVMLSIYGNRTSVVRYYRFSIWKRLLKMFKLLLELQC